MRLLGKGRGMPCKWQRNLCLDEAGYETPLGVHEQAVCLLTVSSMRLKLRGPHPVCIIQLVDVPFMLQKVQQSPIGDLASTMVLTAVTMLSQAVKFEKAAPPVCNGAVDKQTLRIARKAVCIIHTALQLEDSFASSKMMQQTSR